MSDHSLPLRSLDGMFARSTSVCNVPPEKVPRKRKNEEDDFKPAPGLTDWRCRRA